MKPTTLIAVLALSAGPGLVAKPTRSADWLKDEMVIEIPGPDEWPLDADSSEDMDHAP